MRGITERRRLSPHRFRVPLLRIALAVGSAVALGWLGPLARRPDAGGNPMPRASAQAQHVPRALDITPLGTFGGPMTAVAVDGTRVYAVRGTSLEAYDGRDPAKLTFEGRVHVPGAEQAGASAVRIAAGDGRVAVALQGGSSEHPTSTWQVFEARPGEALAIAGSVRVDDRVLQAVVSQSFLYTLGYDGVRVVDLRDAARPAIVATLSDVRLMAMNAGTLFTASSNRRDDLRPAGSVVRAYSIRNPSQPQIVSENFFAGTWIWDLSLYRDQLLVWQDANPRPPSNVSLVMLTAEPPSLAPRGAITLGEWYATDVTVVGDFAAILFPGIREGVHVETFDLRSLPEALPSRQAYSPRVGYGAAAAALGDSLLVVDNERGLLTFQLDPASGALTLRATIDALGAPYGLATDGSFVYTADGDGEVWVLEVQPSGEIEAIAHTRQGGPAGASPLPGLGASLAVAGARLVVTRRGGWGGPNSSVTVWDIADPRQPRPLGEWTPYDDPALSRVGGSISLYGPLAVEPNGPPSSTTRWFVAGRPGLIELDLDIGDPAQPRVRRVYDPDCRAGDGPADWVDDCIGRGMAVDIRDDRVFVARGAAGVQVFDLAPDGPSDPVRTFATGGDSFDVAVNDQAVFVANGSSGLHIVDRRSSRTVDLSGLFAAYRITLVGDTAYLVGHALPGDPSSRSASVWAIDVADPLAPVLRGHVELPTGSEPALYGEAAPHMLLVDDLLLATIPDRGIAVFRLTDGHALPATRLILPRLFVAR